MLSPWNRVAFVQRCYPDHLTLLTIYSHIFPQHGEPKALDSSSALDQNLTNAIIGPVQVAKAHMQRITFTWSQRSVSSAFAIPVPLKVAKLSPIRGRVESRDQLLRLLSVLAKADVSQQYFPSDLVSLGSGLWMPDAARLALLRQDVDQRSERIKRILGHPDVRREIFNGVPKDEKKVVKAFVCQNQETALKTKPKVRDCFFNLTLAPQRLSVANPLGRNVDSFIRSLYLNPFHIALDEIIEVKSESGRMAQMMISLDGRPETRVAV
ncbi:hypothetical protein PRK78_002179 [Emydomyces testavorans]|uniref:Uncharacterized protein n=1 Tax=Emydomyces testavorans TaxID=2070801 RepID=A0AAF0DDY6_9EURO|nr:hypothetical protein PRK78_002179 [Emydomyces testavorans]